MTKIDRLKRVLVLIGHAGGAKEIAGNLNILQEISREAEEIDAITVIPPAHQKQFVTARGRIGNFKAGNVSPVVAWIEDLRKAIEAALATPIPPAATRFPKVQNADFRSILERDLQEAESSLNIGNWKACIVLAGSVLEAALYEYLLRNPIWTMDPNRRSIPNKRGSTQPKNITSQNLPDQWSLEELIRFACDNTLIRNYDERTIGNTLRQPRNLVHPMKEIRQSQTVDENTAKVSLAMIQSVLGELGKLADPI